jgi:hypothetical protein
MARDDPSKILMEGPKIWNDWRERNPRAELHFISPHWYDSPGRRGRQVKGKNRIDFSGMTLSRAYIAKAYAEGLNLRYAVFENTTFEEGDFSRADFRGATLSKTMHLSTDR